MFIALLCLSGMMPLSAQKTDTTLVYRVEMSGNVSSGDYAPLWFTANRNGLSSAEDNSGYLRAGITYNKSFKHRWHIAAGLDLAGAVNSASDFIVQQAYFDVSWRVLSLSIGSKERNPLGKNPQLSSGGMVEGNNTRPVPQIRAGIEDYYTVPGTKGWFAFKGYIAYGRFTDDDWQEDFAGSQHQTYVTHVLYHSKELMLKVGNKEKFPLEVEFGLLMSAQFGGNQHSFSYVDGEWVETITKMPHALKNYAKVFFGKSGDEDTPVGDQVNVEGNHMGSWNFALNYYWRDWKFRVYLEHYFEDHSQMFLEYGRWKDGQLGFEITLPKNPYVGTLLWECMATKDQSGPILYDGDSRFTNVAYPGTQISAGDNYYNNYFYQSWAHYGYGMGNPLLAGPIYNSDGSLYFSSNRARAHHVGVSGSPTNEWGYRVLLSYSQQWGTYEDPFDEVLSQFSSLYEVTYSPKFWKGWHFTIAGAIDRGDYIGNSGGAMITIKKEGICLK